MHILYVSDGKAGHRSQALGLFKAMQKQTNIDLTFEEISIDHLIKKDKNGKVIEKGPLFKISKKGN